MKRNHLLTTGALCLALAAASCCRQAPAPQAKASAEPVSLKDHGAEPTVLNIESHTLANENFRTALWTGSNLQVTLMAIPAGGDVGLEQHHDIDQFLRVEEGTARVMMGDSEDNLDFVREVSDDYAILVPAGKWHNIVNTGDKPLKIYSIYAPAEHPHGTVHKTGRRPWKPNTTISRTTADSCRRVYFTFFTVVSQPVTQRPFLCSVNQNKTTMGTAYRIRCKHCGRSSSTPCSRATDCCRCASGAANTSRPKRPSGVLPACTGSTPRRRSSTSRSK